MPDERHEPSAGGETKARKRRWAIGIGGATALGTLAARRRGYQVGGNTVVRCRSGHLFTTIWVPGASFKAIRLGWWRYQRCPVGRHWTLVTPVKTADLSAAQVQQAREHRDSRIP